MGLKALRKKADQLIWKHRRGCEICLGEASPHHFISRSNKTLRWDLRNIVWLCSEHHISGNFSAHGSPTAFKEWFKENRPEDYKYLMERKNIISKWTEEDMKKIIEELK